MSSYLIFSGPGFAVMVTEATLLLFIFWHVGACCLTWKEHQNANWHLTFPFSAFNYHHTKIILRLFVYSIVFKRQIRTTHIEMSSCSLGSIHILALISRYYCCFLASCGCQTSCQYQASLWLLSCWHDFHKM